MQCVWLLHNLILFEVKQKKKQKMLCTFGCEDWMSKIWKPSKWVLQVGEMDLKVSWRGLHQLSPLRKTRTQQMIPNHYFLGPDQLVQTMNPWGYFMVRGKGLFHMLTQREPNLLVSLLSQGVKRSMNPGNSSSGWDVLMTAIPFGCLRIVLLPALF